MREALICDAVRTAIGRYGGALSTVRADDLAATTIRQLVQRNPWLDLAHVDEVILGCANQAGEDNRNVARMAALLAGLPETVPGTTVNRLCASGAEAIGQAARAIVTGEAEIVVAGGVESMSRAPFVIGKAQLAFDRQQEVHDTTIGWRFINPELRSRFGVDSMPETAENVATEYNVSREDQDRFACESQKRAKAASDRSFHAREIVPVAVAPPRGETSLVETDEHPRHQTTFEQLSKLKPIVRTGGTVTAGNSSGVNDGAAAMILASGPAAKRHGLRTRARILGMASAGVAPGLMGIGPVPATQKLLARLDLTIADFDVIEINEAFAAQVIASARLLSLNPFASNLNHNGGAIALGHPLGASGARLVLTALNMLEEIGGRRALVTMCVGVGQGLSIAIERLD